MDDTVHKNNPEMILRLNSDCLLLSGKIRVSLLFSITGTLYGGARGYYLHSFINWNTKANKKLHLNEF